MMLGQWFDRCHLGHFTLVLMQLHMLNGPTGWVVRSTVGIRDLATARLPPSERNRFFHNYYMCLDPNPLLPSLVLYAVS